MNNDFGMYDFLTICFILVCEKILVAAASVMSGSDVPVELCYSDS